jgi:SMC interacting uncharacterized protein involved in chromosome segregation
MAVAEPDDEREVTAYSTLGERLLVGVRNLWGTVNDLVAKTDRHDKVIAHLFEQVEQMQRDIEEFRKQVHGLKISKGKAVARAQRLQQVAKDVEAELGRLRHRISTVH